MQRFNLSFGDVRLCVFGLLAAAPKWRFFSPRFGYKLVNYENCVIFSYDCTRNIVDYPFKGLALK